MYSRTQVGWAVIVPLFAVLAIALPALLQADLLLTAAAVGGGFGVLLALFGTLTITIDAHAIEARFGIGLLKKRVLLEDLRAFEPATTPWYYGWGIRLYPGGRLYNVSGLRSVELFLRDGTRYRFGTAEPGAVCHALHERLGVLPALSAQERTRAAMQSRCWRVAIVAVSVVLLVDVGVFLGLESRPLDIHVSDDRLAIESLVYDVDVATRDIESVALLDSLPRIEMRTNGFALGTTLRGHFRFTDLGDGELFVDADEPPFVLVEHREGFVIFNASDPAQTRALYERLRPFAQ